MNFNGIQKVTIRIFAVQVLALVMGLPCCYAESAAPEESASAKWRVGSEIDVLPYVMNGYYGSGFVGRDEWRFRGVVARSTTPSFLVTDGFKDKRTDAYALLTDRFMGSKRQKMQGLWIGGGGEWWRNRIRTDASPAYAHYNNFVLTAGAGYVQKLSRHVYVNPWVGSHFVVAGERRISVSGKRYEQPVFTPEGSIKIGIIF